MHLLVNLIKTDPGKNAWFWRRTMGHQNLPISKIIGYTLTHILELGLNYWSEANCMTTFLQRKALSYRPFRKQPSNFHSPCLKDFAKCCNVAMFFLILLNASFKPFMDTKSVDTDKTNPVKWQVCSNIITSIMLNPLLLKPIWSK